MNTLEHLIRIAANDESYIAKLKAGEQRTISLEVFNALYPCEKWAFFGEGLGKFDQSTTFIKKWSEFSGTTEKGPRGHSKKCPEGGYYNVVFHPNALIEHPHFINEPEVWEVDSTHVTLNRIPATHPDAQEVNRRAIAKDPSLIMDWVNPSEELIKFAIDTNPKVFHLLRNPSDDIIKYAIRCRPDLVYSMDPKWLDYALEYHPIVINKINNPTEEQCWRAIRKDPWTIKYIKCQTRDMQWYVLKEDAALFHLIVDPTEDMKWYAIRQKPNNIFHIKNKTPEMEMEAIKHNLGLLFLTRSYTPELLEIIENSTKQFDIGAIPQDKWSDALMLRAAAFLINHRALALTDKFTKSLALKAARQHGVVVKYPNEDVVVAAVRKEPAAVHHDHRVACIRANPQCYKFLLNPSWEDAELAVSLDRRMLMHVTNGEWVCKLKAQFV